MNMVKVNPKLYGTCRLCLEDMGQYMIVPKVQEQIKYCFDIIVKPFDGMPQLICNNCERILREYFDIKKKFILKQDDLLNSISDTSKESQNDTKENQGERQDLSSMLNNKIKKSLASEKKEEILSSCSKNTSVTLQNIVENNKIDTEKIVSSPWQSSYRKQFSCRFCNYIGSHKASTYRHINLCHKNLRVKYKHILNNKFEVKVTKLDKKKNFTGIDNTVVFDKDKIIQDYDKNLFIIYTSDSSKKTRDQNYNDDNECTVSKRKRNDNSNESLALDRRKTLQLSNKVEQNTKETLNEECIYIEDSSDSASEDIDTKSTSSKTIISSKDGVVDSTEESIAVIKDIISTCHTKYKESLTLHPKELHSKSQLKHKVLSIGRKIVNKQGFNCTGLLRYMEHRNLEIIWTPYTPKSISDSNFVRIMTKERGHKEDENVLGWKTLPANIEKSTDTNTKCQHSETQMLLPNRKIILNENPVANPKQMPRKCASTKHNESSSSNTITQNSTTSTNHVNNVSTVSSESLVTTRSMPDIDLMEIKKNNDSAHLQNVKDNEIESPAARIKVKPLCELLSNRGLSEISNSESPSSLLLGRNNLYAGMISSNSIIHTSPVGQSSPIFQLNKMVSVSQMAQLTPIVITSNIAQPCVIIQPNSTVQQENAQVNDRDQGNLDISNKSAETIRPQAAPPTHTEYVIMDTADLPNTNTHSPITYVKTLLHMHNIHLLEKREEFTDKPVCLIKFKVLYKQETLEGAIVLSLSLLCHRNKFCIHVENDSKINVMLNSISANWQWEIIRAFLGDVSTKMLANAQRVNAETYEYTKTFMCLLKSINYRR